MIYEFKYHAYCVYSYNKQLNNPEILKGYYLKIETIQFGDMEIYAHKFLELSTNKQYSMHDESLIDWIKQGFIKQIG